MKSQYNLYELFENLVDIQPSTGWDSTLKKRLKSKKRRGGRNNVKDMVVFVMVLVLVVNLFSFSKSWMDTSKEQKATNLKNLAASFLITTNSSKY
jgi:hypothetical protein